jgi:hypothetical protein
MINCNIVVCFQPAALSLICFFILAHIAIYNWLQMKTEIKAVANTFKTVSGDASYPGHWIQDSDYAAII